MSDLQQQFKNATLSFSKVEPGQATEWINNTAKSIADGTFRQRNRSDGSIGRISNDLSNGEWTVNGDIVMISERGNIINGQHRLSAIATTGISAFVPLALNVPEEQKTESGKTVPTIANMDTGKPRGIGQQLHVAYGHENGYRLAAIAKALAMICANSGHISVTMSQTVYIIGIYKKSIAAIFDAITHSSQRKSQILAPLIFHHHSTPDAALEFAFKLFTLENISANHPAMLLDKWLRSNPVNRATERIRVARVMLYAMSCFESGASVTRLKDTPDSIKWAHSKQRGTVARVANIIRPQVSK